MDTHKTEPTLVVPQVSHSGGITSPEPSSATAVTMHSSFVPVRQDGQSEPESLLAVGSIFEKYRVEKLLSKGGMGAVYLVWHEVLETRFALKILFPEMASRNTDFVERFIREAKLSSKIRHPNLIIVHDAGRNAETGLYYLVMDYVPNGTLRDRLAVSGRILPCEILKVIRPIAEALREAHRCGMVHRDIKPENIMFDEKGNARLADLGIAKSLEADNATLTMAAAVMGTPAYMSPEQAKDSGKIDERADVYSLGIVLYEMLAGRTPFGGSTPLEILAKVLSGEKAADIVGECPDVPAELAALVHGMIEKDPDKRIATADAVIASIDAMDAGVSGAAACVADAPPQNGAPHRRRIHFLIASLSVVVVACFAAVLLSSGPDGGAARQDKKNSPESQI